MKITKQLWTNDEKTNEQINNLKEETDEFKLKKKNLIIDYSKRFILVNRELFFK